VRIHPLAVRSPLVKTPEVLEYQVRQTERGIDLAVVTGGPLDEAALATKVARSLAEAGLTEPEVTVRRVDAIQRVARTGKARRFIPL
jgi:phenylacetate-CoA ligase